VLGIGDNIQRAVARRRFFEKISSRKADGMSRCHERSQVN